MRNYSPCSKILVCFRQIPLYLNVTKKSLFCRVRSPPIPIPLVDESFVSNESLIPYIFNARVLSIECKMVAIISTASQAQAKNGANPIVRHQAHKSRGQSEGGPL